MHVHLMYEDKDFDANSALPENAADLIADLGLEPLFQRMAGDDEWLLQVVQQGVLNSLLDVQSVMYRQAILQDCLNNLPMVQDMYRIALEAIAGERKHYFGIASHYPSSILHRSVEVMEIFADKLEALRGLAETSAQNFSSTGFTKLFSMLQTELSRTYLTEVRQHLNLLKLRNGVALTVQLGQGNKGANYKLRKPDGDKRGFFQKLIFDRQWTFKIADRDESGARALATLRNHGINSVANALAQSTEHVLSFFKQLRDEVGFYVCCTGLYQSLTELDAPICFPVPLQSAKRYRDFHNLYDIGLTLRQGKAAVGNNLSVESIELFVITGANQGGKSTFLRSVGLAQILMQAGMFVPAEDFSANLCNGLFTHFTREEDSTMTSGKLDEELHRMSHLVDRLHQDSLLLCNESFASTNEREASEIARQVVFALVSCNVEVFFVTHLYEFAHGCYEVHDENTWFLRAQRTPNGGRTYRLEVGEPLQTSFGKDLYQNVFSN